jgi:hypothetical protein
MSPKVQAALEKMQQLPQAIQAKWADFATGISKIEFFKPDGKPNRAWKVFYADNLAEARNNALSAARQASLEGSVSGIAASTWEYGLDSASTAVQRVVHQQGRGKEWDDGREAVKGIMTAAISEKAKEVMGNRIEAADTIFDASKDARLMSGAITASDLDFEGKAKHLAHAAARMEVWEKGYGLACDVEGTLYVYAVNSAKPKAGTSRLFSWLSSAKN